METPIINNQQESEYEMYVDGEQCKVEYTRRGDVIYLVHTEVPPNLQGQGIASELVEGVLQDCNEQGLKVVPLCPFVATYIKRHPKWMEVVI